MTRISNKKLVGKKRKVKQERAEAPPECWYLLRAADIDPGLTSPLPSPQPTHVTPPAENAEQKKGPEVTLIRVACPRLFTEATKATMKCCLSYCISSVHHILDFMAAAPPLSQQRLDRLTADRHGLLPSACFHEPKLISASIHRRPLTSKHPSPEKLLSAPHGMVILNGPCGFILQNKACGGCFHFSPTQPHCWHTSSSSSSPLTERIAHRTQKRASDTPRTPPRTFPLPPMHLRHSE